MIVPVYNGGDAFERCLDALADSRFRDWELIVADDGSTDGSAELAARRGAAAVRTCGRLGPAAARNLGARSAHGRYLFFLDSDCAVHPGTLGMAADLLESEPAIDAVFGSYDDQPAAPNFISQYKNLFHHYVHQRADPEAATFWAGCGAVRRTAFEAVGGFDAEQYARPSIEDIELGYRLRGAGFRIRLARTLHVKHLKAWTFETLLRSDIRDRGVPWTQLMLERGSLDGVLNVGRWQRVGVAASCVLFGCLALAPWNVALLVPAVVAGSGLLVGNRDVYRFFARRRGGWFALRAIPLHWLYYLYCAVAFGWGAVRYARARRIPARRATAFEP
ncbi:MAG TPA: glycosyltransferase [Gemmatimonadota bacterium]|nr:glycosyltransferase [Gemmatimonadota bacterium]